MILEGTAGGESDSVNMEDIRPLQTLNGDSLLRTLNASGMSYHPCVGPGKGRHTGLGGLSGGHHAVEIHAMLWPGP